MLTKHYNLMKIDYYRHVPKLESSTQNLITIQSVDIRITVLVPEIVYVRTPTLDLTPLNVLGGGSSIRESCQIIIPFSPDGLSQHVFERAPCFETVRALTDFRKLMLGIGLDVTDSRWLENFLVEDLEIQKSSAINDPGVPVHPFVLNQYEHIKHNVSSALGLGKLVATPERKLYSVSSFNFSNDS